MWATAVYDWRLTTEQFWALTPGQYLALSRKHREAEKRQDYRFGLIACILANAHKATDAKPFRLGDLFPSLEETTKKSLDELGGEELAAVLRGVFGGK